MKRRLDLASSLVHRPQVLFFDEPTTGLDPASRLTIWDEMRRINAQGTTVFLTGHQRGVANAGVVVSDGDHPDLLSRGKRRPGWRDRAKIGRGFAVIAVAGALMVFLNVRTIRSYD